MSYVNKLKLGNTGEALSVEFLQQKGYTFLTQNFHSPFGEIDLVFKDQHNNEIVFVEVKTRSKYDIQASENSITKS